MSVKFNSCDAFASSLDYILALEGNLDIERFNGKVFLHGLSKYGAKKLVENFEGEYA